MLFKGLRSDSHFMKFSRYVFGITILVTAVVALGNVLTSNKIMELRCRSDACPAVQHVRAMPLQKYPEDLLAAISLLRSIEILDADGNHPDGGLQLLEHYLERGWLNEMTGGTLPQSKAIGEAIATEETLEKSAESSLLTLRERAYTAALLPSLALPTDLAPGGINNDPETYKPYGAHIWHKHFFINTNQGYTYVLIALENRLGRTIFLPKYIGIFVKQKEADDEIELACSNRTEFPLFAGEDTWRPVGIRERILVLCQVADKYPVPERSWAELQKEAPTIGLARQALAVIAKQEAATWIIRPHRWHQVPWASRPVSNIEYPLGVSDLLWSPQMSKQVEKLHSREIRSQEEDIARWEQESGSCFVKGTCFAALTHLILIDMYWLHGFMAGIVVFSSLRFTKRRWSLIFAISLSAVVFLLYLDFYFSLAAYTKGGLLLVVMLNYAKIQGIGSLLGIWLMYGAFAYLQNRSEQVQTQQIGQENK